MLLSHRTPEANALTTLYVPITKAQVEKFKRGASFKKVFPHMHSQRDLVLVAVALSS